MYKIIGWLKDNQLGNLKGKLCVTLENSQLNKVNIRYKVGWWNQVKFRWDVVTVI